MKTYQRMIILAASTALLSAMWACGDDGSENDASSLQWYKTCGDPVCGMYQPTTGVTQCTTEVAGDSCNIENLACEIVDDECNADLVCTTSDPTTMCPISQSWLKRSVKYLTDDQRRELARDLLATRLATYRYRYEPANMPLRLGFLIDDQPMSPSVLPNGQRVDLYGYMSMAVAALQIQDQRIAQLERSLAELKAELAGLRGAPAADRKAAPLLSSEPDGAD